MDNNFWQQFDRGVFLLNVLAIIKNDKGEILIGKRENDPYIKKLSWTFPGGRPAYQEDLEYYLKLEVKKKTNYDIEVGEVIFARTYTEDRRFLSIYYEAKIVGGAECAGEKFVETKWVKSRDLNKYFTTSIHPKLLEKIDII